MSKTLGTGFMDYMETAEAPFLAVETTAGTWFLPGDVVGTKNVTLDDVRDYVEGEPQEIEVRETGILWRMTAPGYMDSTDWTPAADETEAETEARETYEIDEDEDSE